MVWLYFYNPNVNPADLDMSGFWADKEIPFPVFQFE